MKAKYVSSRAAVTRAKESDLSFLDRSDMDIDNLSNGDSDLCQTHLPDYSTPNLAFKVNCHN